MKPANKEIYDIGNIEYRIIKQIEWQCYLKKEKKAYLTHSLLCDPHVGHAGYAPSAGDPPEAHSFNFDSVQKNSK